jgi:hypothetical protein
MQRIEKILDQAIKRLRSGENYSSVLSSYPQKFQAELSEMLGVFRMASNLPKKTAPEPMRRKLFLDAEVNFAWYKRFFVVLRYSAPIALLFLVLTLTGTVHAALGSLPGDVLFPVKKAVETTEIKLSVNAETRAKLQLDLASQRLEEAQTVIAQTEDPNVKEKAIKELNEQTDTALKNLKAVASTPGISQNPEIIAKAEKLTKDQKNLAVQVDPETAKKVSLAHRQTIEDIKGIIATTADQSAATIAASDKITITSNIDAIKNNTIRIDKNTFEIDKKAVLENQEGDTITLDDLQVNDTVKIEGKVNEKNNSATHIVLIAKAPKPEDKSPVAEKPTDKPKTTTSTKPTPGNTGIVPPKPETKPEIPENAPPVEKPQDTYGGLIPESPTSSETTAQ